MNLSVLYGKWGRGGGGGGRENRGREGAQKGKVVELGRKFATMLNFSQSKRAKGSKPRKMGRESRKQGTGGLLTGRTPLVPLPSLFSKSVIQVTLSSCIRLEEKLARMLDVREEY